ncbi:hypothetical protein GCM10011348_07570 [Marinobacterium nitratireducens]|uniref:Uncharacterized protein n=1 Tax=Marinobacterium nitratireducens TaxID=518897 RepID=A0A917Z801_9GAMM|nr:hypothetical protein [Marinobacterium nitratireducens]GGO77614.1 hypothetical protein GCM10011348_07570 [Marinobacterium nitratireducens]
MAEPRKGIELLYLAERYEYRVIATSVLDHILFESALSDGARNLWLILYRGAALNRSVRSEASAAMKTRTTTQLKLCLIAICSARSTQACS